MAPEAVRQERFGRKSDVWSVGGVLLQMATGDPPWKRQRFKSPMALFYHIAHTDGPPPLEPYAERLEKSPRLRALLLRCFTRDPDARPSAAACPSSIPRIVVSPRTAECHARCCCVADGSEAEP